MPVCIRALRAGFALLLLWIAAPAAAEVTVILRPDMSREQIGTVLDVLKDRGETATLRWEATPAAAAASPAAPGEPRALARAFETGLTVRLAGLPRLGELPRDVARRWAENENGSTGAVLTRLAATILTALAAGWLVRRLGAVIAGHARTRLRGVARRLTADLTAIVTFFAVGTLLQRPLLPAPDLAATVATELVRDLAIVGLYMAAGRFLLSPGEPRLRLLPMAHAEWHFRMLMAYGAIGAAISLSVTLIRAAGSDTAPVEAWFLIGGTIITLQKLWWFWHGRHDVTALFRDHGTAPAGLVQRLTAAALPWMFILVALLIWATGSLAVTGAEGLHWGAAAGATQVIVIVLPIVVIGADALVSLIGRAHPESEPMPPVHKAGFAALRTLLRGGIWATGLYVIASLWNLFLLEPSSLFFVGASAQVGVALVIGFAIWSFLESYFQAHLPRARLAAPGEEEHLPDPPGQARLATVLPIVRDLAFGAVVAATALVSLSALGMDIGPLLAGFGVLGLAISFGSQALVRDIVSGIFFMADDAFRIGEYVDTGRLRGTVERITLRSLQLRHQNGQVHTIPFGTLASVTNFSRDWTTVKFLIRLDHAADMETARKVIKKVGLQMLEDPAFAGEFILPLKLQGIQEITDAAIVVRCKFTCKPNKPTWLQREALKRIHAALRDAGIPIATNAVTVRSGTREEAAAAQAIPIPPPRAGDPA